MNDRNEDFRRIIESKMLLNMMDRNKGLIKSNFFDLYNKLECLCSKDEETKMRELKNDVISILSELDDKFTTINKEIRAKELDWEKTFN